MTTSGSDAVDGVLAAVVARLPEFLPRQRWFGGKGRPIERVEIRDRAVLPEYPDARLLLVDVVDSTGERATYFLPVVVAPESAESHAPESAESQAPEPVGSPAAGPIVRQDGVSVHDGLIDPAACRGVLRGIAAGRTVETARGGRFAFRPTAARPGEQQPPLAAIDVSGLEVRRLSVEQSNSSVLFGDKLILKAFRRTQPGQNPEVEILRFLGEHTTFNHVPRLLGWAEYQAPDETSMPVGVLEAFVPNEGDGWDWVLRSARASTVRAPGSGLGHDRPGGRNPELGTALAGLGRTLAELHLALASRPDLPDLAPEPITADDVSAWRGRILLSLTDALRHIQRGLTAAHGQGGWSADLRPDAEAVRDGAGALRAAVERLGCLADGRTVKTRHHGDFHLGQTLIGPGGWTIIDFEGEPLRSLAERRARHTPLRDVAGLLRSLDYAEVTLARELAAGSGSAAADSDPVLAAGFAEARRAFLDAYVGTVRTGDAPLLPSRDGDLAAVLEALEVEKALYELGYEIGNRPDWIAIPLSALARLARDA